MWIVVIFTNDNCVAAVPLGWFHNGLCAWPKDKIKNRNKMIKLKSTPNSLQFNYFPAKKITSKIYASLKTAHDKAIEGQKYSDLSSAEETTVVKPRKTIPGSPILSDHSDCDDTDMNPSYTPNKKEMPLDLESPVLSLKNDDQIFSSTSQIKFKNVQKHLFTSTLIDDQIASTSSTDLIQNAHDDPAVNLLFGNSMASVHNSIDPIQSVFKNSNDKETTEFRNFVKTALTNIKYELKVISYSIDSIKTQLSAQNIETNDPLLEIQLTEDLPWPIKSSEELDDIEKQLQTKTVLNSEAVKLSRLAGRNISETVRRIMMKMFEDTFLKHFSYLGFKGKNKFNGLFCCQLLFEAIRKDKRYLPTTDSEISVSVSKWLAQATNRLNKKAKKNYYSPKLIYN